jgi:hypothetical protein
LEKINAKRNLAKKSFLSVRKNADVELLAAA